MPAKGFHHAFPLSEAWIEICRSSSRARREKQSRYGRSRKREKDEGCPKKSFTVIKM